MKMVFLQEEEPVGRAHRRRCNQQPKDHQEHTIEAKRD
jgi:hypothetical protein